MAFQVADGLSSLYNRQYTGPTTTNVGMSSPSATTLTVPNQTTNAQQLYDFSKGLNAGGVNWNFGSNVDPMITPSGTEGVYSAAKNLGYGGNYIISNAGNADAVSGMSSGAANWDNTPGLQDWINQQGWQWGTGNTGGNTFGSYFDKYGNPIQGTGVSNKLGYDWGWTVPVAMFLGGLGAAELTGGQAATTGTTAAGNSAISGSTIGQAMAGPEVTGMVGGSIPGAGVPGMATGTLGGGPVNPAITAATESIGAPAAGNPGVPGAVGNNPSAYIPAGAEVAPIMQQAPTAAEIASAVNNPAVPYGLEGVFNPTDVAQAAGAAGGAGDASIPTGGTPTLPNIPGGNMGMDFLNNLWNRATSGQGLASLLGIYNANQQQDVWNQQMANLENLYSVNSPYAQAARQQIERKDAAAGRNSQYGPREVELAASLADRKGRAMNDLLQMQSNALKAQTSGFRDLGAILGGLGGAGSSQSLLGSLGNVSEGFKSLWDSIFGD